MKNKKYSFILILLCLSVLACGCGNKKNQDDNNISLKEVAQKLAENGNIPSPQYLDLNQKENAEKYLLATEDIEEGIAVNSQSMEQADKIILVKANDTKTVQDVERSLGAVLVGLTTTWENNDTENKKVEEHVLKTKDKYVLLYVGEKNEEAEKIFDYSF